MEKNFFISNAVEIDVAGCAYDLHNFYDFKEVKIEVEGKVVSLMFSINAEAFNEKLVGKLLSLKFIGVDYLEFSPSFVPKITHDLEEIGYKNAGDADINWLIDESKSTESDHLLFRFANDEFIRIHSETVYCSTD